MDASVGLEVVESVAWGKTPGCETIGPCLVIALRGDEGHTIHFVMSKPEYDRFAASLGKAALEAFGRPNMVAYDN